MNLLVEKDGRHAFAIPDDRHTGKWMVVTARMMNPMGAGAPHTKHPHDGPNDNLTQEQAEKQAGRWERYLEAEIAGDAASGKRKR